MVTVNAIIKGLHREDFSTVQGCTPSVTLDTYLSARISTRNIWIIIELIEFQGSVTVVEDKRLDHY